MHITLRAIEPADEPFLWRMLYHSLFVPPEHPPLPPEIVYHPRIASYVAGWGRQGDEGVIAVNAAAGTPVGAAWLRCWSKDDRGFGFLDERTPELTVAVLPEVRGQGIGTALLQSLLASVPPSVPRVSLSVNLDNPAARLYQRLGFVVVQTTSSAWVMHWQRPAVS
jgi:GNAT superfamily N-acetyltransferase